MKTQEISTMSMIHSGMGRDVTQRVSVVAMLTLLLGSVLIFLMKRMKLLRYEHAHKMASTMREVKLPPDFQAQYMSVYYGHTCFLRQTSH